MPKPRNPGLALRCLRVVCWLTTGRGHNFNLKSHLGEEMTQIHKPQVASDARLSAVFPLADASMCRSWCTRSPRKPSTRSKVSRTTFWLDKYGDSTLQQLSAAQWHSHARTQVCWAPNGHGIVFVGFSRKPHLLGLRHYNTRPSKLYYAELPQTTTAGREDPWPAARVVDREQASPEVSVLHSVSGTSCP